MWARGSSLRQRSALRTQLSTYGHSDPFSVTTRFERLTSVCNSHNPQNAQLTPRRPHVIDSQLDSMDDLYCETCGGIPIDRYQRMQPLDHPKRLRQSYALTRAVLVSALGIDEYQLDAMLCSPLFSTNLPDFDWRSTHKLCCGHLVFSAPIRPCASNCALGSGCQSSLEPLNWREGDAILCQECVLRSDSVFKKFAKVEQATKSPEDSGYGSAGPQSTSSFGDYGNQFDG
jgi:hypothetical protein